MWMKEGKERKSERIVGDEGDTFRAIPPGSEWPPSKSDALSPPFVLMLRPCVP